MNEDFIPVDRKNGRHHDPKAEESQCAAILSELTRAAGEWVSMPRLVEVSGSYNIHSRISDLRKRGHLVDQKSLYAAAPGGRTKNSSFYRLRAGTE